MVNAYFILQCHDINPAENHSIHFHFLLKRVNFKISSIFPLFLEIIVDILPDPLGPLGQLDVFTPSF